MNRIIAEYLFAPSSTCMGCGSVRGTDRDFLCADCYASLNPLFVLDMAQSRICANCGEEYVAGQCSVCGKRKPATLLTSAAYQYEGAIQELVQAFKFEGVWRMADWMAGEMLKACEGGFLDNVSLIVPVPMHKARLRARGFNQSIKLAEAFSRLTGIPEAQVIARTRNTRQQVKLSEERRRVNLKDAFEASPNEGALKDDVVILIDDVRTTGSTAVECARTLIKGGAKEVRVLTFAKTIRPHAQGKKYNPDRGIKLLKRDKEAL